MLYIITFHISLFEIFSKSNDFPREKKYFFLPHENELLYDRDFCITYLMWTAKNVCFMQYRFINRSEIVRWGCFSIFFANHFYYLNSNLKKRDRVQCDTPRRVHWDTPSRRTPHMLNLNINLDVYPAGFHLKFICNYDYHRKNVKK